MNVKMKLVKTSGSKVLNLNAFLVINCLQFAMELYVA